MQYGAADIGAQLKEDALGYLSIASGFEKSVSKLEAAFDRLPSIGQLGDGAVVAQWGCSTEVGDGLLDGSKAIGTTILQAIIAEELAGRVLGLGHAVGHHGQAISRCKVQPGSCELGMRD